MQRIITAIGLMSLLLHCSARPDAVILRAPPPPVLKRTTLEFRMVQSGPTFRINTTFRRELEGIRRMTENGLPRENRLFQTEIRTTLRKLASESGGAKVYFHWRRDRHGLSQLAEFLAVGPPVLDCHDIKDARYTMSAYGDHEVLVDFTKNGAQKMHKLSQANLRKRLAIVWRGEVIAAPRIHDTIEDKAVISGRFHGEDTREIAEVIRKCIPTR